MNMDEIYRLDQYNRLKNTCYPKSTLADAFHGYYFSGVYVEFVT